MTTLAQMRGLLENGERLMAELYCARERLKLAEADEREAIPCRAVLQGRSDYGRGLNTVDLMPVLKHAVVSACLRDIAKAEAALRDVGVDVDEPQQDTRPVGSADSITKPLRWIEPDYAVTAPKES